jgi:hypothetical protein
MTFVRNHAQAVVPYDLFIVVTGSFRVLYVFVLVEVGTRRIAHFNVTAHPTGRNKPASEASAGNVAQMLGTEAGPTTEAI